MEKQRVYAAIDLKSFFASVECIERGLDPMVTNLVVADESRTEKTICLAVSPGLKSFGVGGRPRLFEVVQRVDQVNALRQLSAPGRRFSGASRDTRELEADPGLAVDYIVAKPQMAKYMAYSSRVYQVYLKHIAPEDIHVYSIDEVFIDLTPYLGRSGLTPRQLVTRIVRDVVQTTGITATAGIGSNLYLCKIAMDILAKKAPADEYGVRLAQLDEMEYRRQLWDHRPLTDFWRVGRGTARRLEKVGLYTMGDIARCSLGAPEAFHNEGLLYKLLGVNAQLLIDHAWGQESCTIAQIKAYRPSTRSLCSGQVLHCPYPFEKARLIAKEMADQLTLELVEKGLVTDQLVLTVGYDIENLSDPARCYAGPVEQDHYGRKIPKHGHGTVNLDFFHASSQRIVQAVGELFDRVADPSLSVRRLQISANHLKSAHSSENEPLQLDLFGETQAQKAEIERENRRQQAVIRIRSKYGKNAIFRGMNLLEGATARERNGQIGGHKA